MDYGANNQNVHAVNRNFYSCAFYTSQQYTGKYWTFYATFYLADMANKYYYERFKRIYFFWCYETNVFNYEMIFSSVVEGTQTPFLMIRVFSQNSLTGV